MKTLILDKMLTGGFRVLQLLGLTLLAACAAPTAQNVAKPIIPVFPMPPEEARFIYERTLFSSADVVKEDKNADLRRMLTGEPRVGEGMGKPYGVAAYKGRIYVSDTALRAIVVFDIPGQRFFKIGDDENDPRGKLLSPFGLDVDGNGNLYVVDAGSKSVKVYGPDGKYLRELARNAGFSRPTGIAVDAAGARIYVVDIGGIGKPNAHIKLPDGTSLKVESAREVFRDDKINRLYKIAMVRITADYNVVTRQYRSARLIGFEEHQQSLDEQALEKLTQRGAKAWKDVPTASAWVDALRGSAA